VFVSEICHLTSLVVATYGAAHRISHRLIAAYVRRRVRAGSRPNRADVGEPSLDTYTLLARSWKRWREHNNYLGALVAEPALACSKSWLRAGRPAPILATIYRNRQYRRIIEMATTANMQGEEIREKVRERYASRRYG